MGELQPNLPPLDGDAPSKSPQTNTPSILATDIDGATRRILVDSERAVYVHVKSNSAGVSPFTVAVNKYGLISPPASTETTVVSFTVPVSTTFYLTKVIGWGEVDAEYTIKVDSVVKGGGWTSEQMRTLCLDYETSPVVATSGQVVDITAVHFDTGTPAIKANLLGGTI